MKTVSIKIVTTGIRQPVFIMPPLFYHPCPKSKPAGSTRSYKEYDLLLRIVYAWGMSSLASSYIPTLLGTSPF